MNRRAAAYSCCGLGLALLLGCAPAPTADSSEVMTGVYIEGFEIRNGLAYALTDVMIDVPSTGAFAGCGNIMPRSECSSTFELRDYRQNAVVISWKEWGEPHQTDEFTVALPPGAEPGDALILEVHVFAPGQVGAQLRKTESARLRNR